MCNVLFSNQEKKKETENGLNILLNSGDDRISYFVIEWRHVERLFQFMRDVAVMRAFC